MNPHPGPLPEGPEGEGGVACVGECEATSRGGNLLAKFRRQPPLGPEEQLTPVGLVHYEP